MKYPYFRWRDHIFKPQINNHCDSFNKFHFTFLQLNTTLYHLWFRGRGVLDVGDVEVGALLVALQPRHVDPEAAGDDALAAPPRLPLAPLGRGRGHRLVGARPHPHRAVALLTLLEPPVWST